MHVTEFAIESFRGGNPLRLLDLGGGLNVALVGSGEGAAELLQIIPGTLFGQQRFFSQDSANLLADSGESTLVVRGNSGVFRIARRWGTPYAEVALTALDGRAIEPAYLSTVLNGVDWREYRDVFTFDLGRLERLLRQPEKFARALRRMGQSIPAATALPVAVPRVVTPSVDLLPLRSRVDSLMALTTRALKSSQLPHSPETARGSIEDLSRDMDRLQQAILDTQNGLSQIDSETLRDAGLLAAGNVRGLCSSLEAELSKARRTPKHASSDGASQATLDRTTERIDATKEELQQLRGELAETSGQIRELNKDNGSTRWIPHVEALMAHEKSLLREEDALEQMRERIEDLQGRIDTQKLDSPLREARPASTTELQAISRLETLNDRIREAEAEQARLEQRLAQPVAVTTPHQSLATNLSVEDPVAVHQAERRVEELRERVGMSGRYGELLEQRAQLEERVRDMYERRLPPPAMVVFFGIPFVAGLGLVIHALFWDRQNTNWQQVGWGAVLVAATVIIKLILDNQSSQDLDMARVDLRKVKDQLDRSAGLGAPGASSALRAELRAAEQEVKELRQRTSVTESIAPPLPRPTESISSEVVRGQVQDARRRVKDLTQQFRDLLRDLDLTPTFNLAQARENIMLRIAQAAQAAAPATDAGLPFQLQALKSEWERRREWLTTNRSQAKQIAQELGCQHPGETIAESFDVLRDAMREHKERLQARIQLVKSYKRLRQRALRLRDQGRQLVKQRRKLAFEQQVRITSEKARHEQGSDRSNVLRQYLDRAVRSLDETAAVLGLAPASLQSSTSTHDVEARLAGLRRRRDELRDSLIAQAEQLGKLRAELAARQESSTPQTSASPVWHEVASLAQDLQRLCNSVSTTASSSMRTQALAPTLDDVEQADDRETIELGSVSSYLAQLTAREYTAVLRDSTGDLLIREGDGDLIDLAELPDRHLANIYFALWLARIDAYAQRGRRLPLVMHDPLAVTPRGRRGAVARLLKEFTARGHQVLLVTSHPRHARALAAQGVPVANLANRERIPSEPHSNTSWSHHSAESAAASTSGPVV